jgi:Sec7-like guanine-nucleotide exchange factor
MLNTNLHNLNVKEKQTVDQFIKMCRDTAKSEDLNEQMLKVKIKKKIKLLKQKINNVYFKRNFIIT